MGMQQDADSADYPAITDGGTGMVVPCPCGPGGNAVMTNGNEAEVIEASYEYTTIQTVGWQPDDSHITPAFREQAL